MESFLLQEIEGPQRLVKEQQMVSPLPLVSELQEHSPVLQEHSPMLHGLEPDIMEVFMALQEIAAPDRLAEEQQEISLVLQDFLLVLLELMRMLQGASGVPQSEAL